MGRLKCYIPDLDKYDINNITKIILSPSTAQIAKICNKYIKILFRAKQLLSEGTPIDQLGYRPPTNQIAINEMDISDLSDTLTSVDSELFDNM